MTVLIGYMGAGKTTLGKALAAKMGCDFCDLDWYIEQSTQRSIPQIFAEDGEDGFRQTERRCLHEVLASDNAVVAVGGGTPCFYDNMEFMNRYATTIYLEANPETLKTHIRMGGSKRPLVDGKTDEELTEYITESLSKREPYYRQAKHTLHIDTITTEDQIAHYVNMLSSITQQDEYAKTDEILHKAGNSHVTGNARVSSHPETQGAVKPHLTIVKVGGKIVEEAPTLAQLIADFSQIKGNKLLVHGGGRSATQMATRLGIETKMVDGRRITDADMLSVVTMVYGGLVNKNIVAGLQAEGVNALGLTGADMNVIHSHQRPPQPIDFGYVGDVDAVDADRLATIINGGITPVMAPLTHDGKGHMLNTNADTIAAEVAKALTRHFDVTLMYCFEKAGVLRDENDDDSVISHITHADFEQLVEQQVVQGGMIPKLQNALSAVDAGVTEVIITKASAIGSDKGTKITK